MYDAMATGNSAALTLDDFGLLSLPRPARKKLVSRKPKTKPASTQPPASPVQKLSKPR